MISRRRLLSGLGLLGLSISQDAHARTLTKRQPSTDVDDIPPHCAALTLVWKTQKDLIKTAEPQHAKIEQTKQKEYIKPESRWWFDSNERGWEVVRPFPPGGVDSTHWFVVTYSINQEQLISWSVDTRKKTVKVMSNLSLAP